MPYRFGAKKRIKSRKKIEQLFAQGSRINIPPLQLIFITEKLNRQEVPIISGISVPKKKFKKAVDRNLLKRRMREALRLNLPEYELYFASKEIKCHLLFIYGTYDILPFKIIEDKIILSLQRLKEAHA